jgi:hypothetical protein
MFEFGQRGEIVGRQDFSLNDRETDLDSVEPTGVDRGVDGHRQPVRVQYSPAAVRRSAPLGRTVN